VFVDAGESAKTIDRPEFRRMLEQCRRGRGRLHAVVVYSLTRFSRNNADHHAIATLLRGLGIALRSVTEPIDDSPSGRLMEGILASFMAQFDNDARSERVTAGHEGGRRPRPLGVAAPLGYVNGHRGGPSLMPDPDRAAGVREAFELCAAGIVGAALLQRVRDLGLRTKQGRPSAWSRLYELLRQPVYMGIVRNATWGKDKRGDFEPLVSEHTFARVQGS
jgi:site-specific DNA recombinase